MVAYRNVNKGTSGRILTSEKYYLSWKEDKDARLDGVGVIGKSRSNTLKFASLSRINGYK